MTSVLDASGLRLPLEAEALWEHLPQRPPMLLLSRLLKVDVETMKGAAEAEFGPNSPVLDSRGRVAPEALLECMAQAFAAVEGYCRAVKRSAPPAAPGMLAAVRKAMFSGRALAGTPLLILVEAVGRFEAFTMIQGEVLQQGELLATAELKLYKPEGNA